MATKDEIRPIYAELRGFLLEAPVESAGVMYDREMWNLYNHSVDELIQFDPRYDRFKLTPETQRGANDPPPRVRITQYRTKLSGLISRLHAEFFADESSPLAGSPNMVISQQQSQSVHIQMEIIEQLTRSETKFKEGTKERGFIDKVKGRLKSAMSGITNVAQLILLLLNTAKEFGLNVDDLERIFVN